MTPRLNLSPSFLSVTTTASLSHASTGGFDASPVLLGILFGGNAAGHSLNSDPSERLRQSFGPSWEEFRSLAQESDPAIFYESLFSLGARLERENYLDAAGAIYRALASPSSASIPSSLQSQALRRWEAMTGIGSTGARAEFLLRRFAGECSDPSALLGMGLAGAAFRMTRLAVLSRLAASPTAAFFTRGIGARLAAGLAGFAVEGLVFPSATRLGNFALDRRLDWSSRQLGHELVSSYLSLGFLRLGGGLASRGLTGLAAEGSLTARALPGMGMWFGIYLGHQTEMALGLRPRLDRATTLLDSLAMLLQFHVAGRLTHHAFGESFRSWEQGIELQTHALASEGRSFSHGSGPQGSSYWAEPSPVAGEGHVLPEGKLPDLPTAWMSGIEKGEGSGGRLSAPGELREESPSLLPQTEEGAWEVESFPQILRHIATPAFRAQFQRENVMFRLNEVFPEDLQSRAEALQSYLNIFSASAKSTIPIGRRFAIHSEVSHQTLYLLKSSTAGFEFRLPGPVLRSEESRPSNPAVFAREPSVFGVAAFAAKPRPARASSEVPKVIREVPQLMEAIVGELQASKPGKSFQSTLILEGAEIDLRALSESTQNLQIRSTGSFRVLVPKIRRTFVGTAGQNGISWIASPKGGWGSAWGRVIFSEAFLKNSEEAYQQVEAYSRDRERADESESKWTVREKVGDPVEFGRFLLETLNSYRIKGTRISVDLTEEGKGLVFEGKDGSWRARPMSSLVRPDFPREVATKSPAASVEAPNTAESAEPVQRGTVLRSPSIPLLHRNEMDHISAVLQRAYADGVKGEGPRVVIVETSRIKYPEGSEIQQLNSTVLDKLTQGLRSFELGTEFQVFNIPTRQTFVGRVTAEGLRWSVGNGSEWRIAAMRAVRQQSVKVGNAVELYLYLQALPNKTRGTYSATEEGQFNEREISILWEGAEPRTYQYDLKTFVTYSLITHVPYGKNLSIEFASGASPIRMENYRGDLWMELQQTNEGHVALEGAGEAFNGFGSPASEGRWKRCGRK